MNGNHVQILNIYTFIDLYRFDRIEVYPILLYLISNELQVFSRKHNKTTIFIFKLPTRSREQSQLSHHTRDLKGSTEP